jgi:hypothetical protein
MLRGETAPEYSLSHFDRRSTSSPPCPYELRFPSRAASSTLLHCSKHQSEQGCMQGAQPLCPEPSSAATGPFTLLSECRQLHT